MTQADATLVGTLLDGRYRVMGLLARGGMATVFRGVDTRLDRQVAIKVMHPQYAADRTFAERFEREARAAAQLHHPHVVAVYDQGVDQHGDQAYPFLVMELVDGGTLRDLLTERGAIDVPLAVAIALPALRALSAAHDAGLVHRDVKPENVLLGRDRQASATGGGIAKVADFGLVRAMATASTTSSSVILGTVTYLAPEQVTTGDATARSDVYSFGVLLFEMLTGQVPYTGDTALSVAYRHVNEDVPAPSSLNPNVPPALDELVLRATRRAPEARFDDARALLTELDRVRQDLGVPAVAVPALPPPDRDQDTTTGDTVPVSARNHAGRTTRALSRAVPLAADEDAGAGVAGRSWRRRAVLLALLGLLALAFVGAGVWWFGAAQSTTVPDVEGMAVDEAEAELRQAELTAEVSHRRHNTVEAGLAIGTEPPAGSQLDTGDSVELLISAGRPVVPHITEGTDRADAEAAITEVELVPNHDPGADEYHRSVAEGDVIRVQPEPGSELDIGSEVTMVLSLGPPPDPVPDVTGMSRDNAFDRLREEGFDPYEAGEEFAEGVEPGHVVRTDPEAGATPEGDTPRVGVVVSNAVEVPGVTGRTISQAESILAEHGLTAEVDGGAGRFSIVVSQSPSSGELIEPGGTVTIDAFP
ncbi:Stk1 family PASTA domain-containing Ser/Thr kinase [Haloechinothrix sp. LS1_15]|uniref:Stk1 family PASTA domain-containing Ser/Thr kinase n=1 Tax=Haloechinothrix sp. LS1_15 TaxID=2652248 RepID=UPI002946B5CA|nr:Stk1 family PASTA domain-containing Ser/Thr kinase [Haloechinothrix sp. LS1_15]MDV6012663.1 Stk1 family PASTA domain-containing Ser/Thr kinase [Haloechinothrix sp. LS1_15]